MMNETRERFLRGILERVSPERIVEIHFFPPIRQGQLESGVAVVALESVPITVQDVALESVADELGADAENPDSATDDPADASERVDAVASTEAASDIDAEESAVEELAVEELAAEELADAAVAVAVETVAPVMAVASRLEVCTASYRWTRKGPERGKWEFDFKTEGDASLPIVGTVVRGVEQRSGDELGALRMDADELHALMESPAWHRPTP
jgi:hypothetical protein